MVTCWHEELANGLRILGEERPDMETVCFGFLVGAGSRDESPAESGAAHFLEHMFFRGTPDRSGRQLKAAFEFIGAMYQAHTAEEQTCVMVRSLGGDVALAAFHTLCDVLSPALRAEDFAVEQQVILEEIAQYRDHPVQAARQQLRHLFFGSHPLGNPVLGTAESVNALKPQQLAAFFQRHYVPGNMVLVAVGNLDRERILQAARERCGEWRGISPVQVRESVCVQDRLQLIHRPGWTKQIILARVAAPGLDSPLADAAECSARLLGDSRNSHLHWRLVESGLADQVQATWRGLEGAGYLEITVSCAPDHTTQVLETLRAELRAVCREVVAEAEFERAQTKAGFARVMSVDGPVSRLIGVGTRMLARLPYRTPAETVRSIADLRAGDLRALGEAFPMTDMATVLVGPLAQL
jgi:predicted Zn-dependent peptidase